MFHLAAITRRKDALFQTMSIGGADMSATDAAQLNAIRTEVMIWRALETAVREPLCVFATPSSGGMFNVRASPGVARDDRGRYGLAQYAGPQASRGRPHSFPENASAINACASALP